MEQGGEGGVVPFPPHLEGLDGLIPGVVGS